jgi:hypothetical protein
MFMHPFVHRRATSLLIMLGLLAGGAVTGAWRFVPTEGAVDGGPSVLLSSDEGRSPYAGVVRYRGRVQCTGVFVETFEGRVIPRDTPAYVLTNGHCPEFPGSNQVITDVPAPATHRVVFNYFRDAVARQFEVPVSRIAYATMKGQDIAVLELAVRYRELIDRGFEPWPIALSHPTDEEAVVVVGAPLMNTPGESFLRLAACRLESKAAVVLEYVWHWFDFYRNACADIRGGSSGSPVISRYSGRVVGLVNTTTNGAAPYTECALNHPCEPVAAGITAFDDTSYMTPVADVGHCFSAAGWLDLTRSDCPLDLPQQVTVIPSFLGARNPNRETVIIGAPRQRWDVTVGGAFDYYRSKVVGAASGDCRDLRGYGSPRRVLDQPVIDEPFPKDEGTRFLCVIGGTRSTWGLSWQDVDHPAVVVVRIDTTPPTIPAPIKISESEIAWIVTFEPVDPEISTYTYKFGRPAETRCDDPAGYRLALIPFISLPKTNRPYLFCAIPHDSALNPGSPFESLLP